MVATRTRKANTQLTDICARRKTVKRNWRRCSTRAEVELRVRLTFAHLRTPCVIVDDGAEAIASEELNEALRPYFEEMHS